MRLQIGKLNFIGVRLEWILVSPDHVPIDLLIERSPSVSVDVKYIEDMY